MPRSRVLAQPLSKKDLIDEAGARLRSMLRAGTTTVESKSGYGLWTEAELKLLRANRALDEATPVDVLSTFLGAHGFPPDVPRDAYLRTVVDEMTPLVAEEGLAEFADVWCDDGHYTAAESRLVLEPRGGRDGAQDPCRRLLLCGRLRPGGRDADGVD